jgi:GTP cyclohydrolase II
MLEDGEPYTAEHAHNFAEQHGLPIISVAELRAYRRRREDQAAKRDAVGGPTGSPQLETESMMYIEDVEADCMIRVYSTADPKIEVVTVVKGDLQGKEGVPARVHSECFTGDVLASKRCDCGQQLHKYLRILNAEPCGVLLYVRGHEGRGIGLSNKIKAYKLQDEGLDTVEANLHLGLPVDTRTYEDALCVLLHLGVRSIRLYTNNPEKMESLQAITKEVVALASVPCKQNMKYLRTKRERCNHRTVLETFELPKVRTDFSKIRIGVVYTTWNKYYVDELFKASKAKLEDSGAIHIKMAVSGACELISGARAMVRHGKPDAIIVLGVLIRGNSDLYDATCAAVLNGLMELNASQDTPIVSGVLMCQNEDQAHERSHGSGNPAKAWAETALHMATLANQLETEIPPPPEPVFQRVRTEPVFQRVRTP